MRYDKQPDVTFTLGLTSVTIKEPIPYTPPSLTPNKVKVDGSTSLDEIASRLNVYGEQMESECYKIFNENVIELFESRFNINKIEYLRIP